MRVRHRIHHHATPQELFDAFTAPDGECIVWLKSRSHGHYGNVWHNGRIWAAHRLFYTFFVGPIPEGKQLHHVCCNTACVKPDHLQPVTPYEHVSVEPGHGKQRTHCPHGHLYDAENTKHQRGKGSNGTLYWKRVCRACHRADEKRRKALRAAA